MLGWEFAGSGAVSRSNRLGDRGEAVTPQKLGEVLLYPADQRRAVEDQGRIQLYQAGARPDFGIGLGAGVNSSDTNQRQPASRQTIHVAQQRGRGGKQRRAAETPRFFCVAAGEAGGASDRRVRYDEAIDSRLHHDGRDFFPLGNRQIGGNFDQHRHMEAGFLARSQGGSQERAQALSPLQLPQTRCIGRRDVDHKVVCEPSGAANAQFVISDRIAGVAVRAEIDPDYSRAGPASEALDHRIETAAIEPHPIDDRLIGFEAEDTRLRISRLRPGRYGSDLDKAKAEPKHRVRHAAILVIACSEPDRVGEIETP